MRFVHPLKASRHNFFHSVSRNPWEVIIFGPVADHHYIINANATFNNTKTLVVMDFPDEAGGEVCAEEALLDAGPQCYGDEQELGGNSVG